MFALQYVLKVHSKQVISERRLKSSSDPQSVEEDSFLTLESVNMTSFRGFD